MKIPDNVKSKREHFHEILDWIRDDLRLLRETFPQCRVRFSLGKEPTVTVYVPPGEDLEAVTRDPRVPDVFYAGKLTVFVNVEPVDAETWKVWEQDREDREESKDTA